MSVSFNDRLYSLLPSIYRQRDAALGEPLRALLAVIAEQVDAVEQDMAGLYDNWFIETCADWVVPYIGDLIAYSAIRTVGDDESGALATGSRAQDRERILYPRSEVANTLRYRRRKGTLALLDRLASDVAGWPAHVTEYDRLVAATQSLNHLRPGRGAFADVRRADLMEHLDTPFDDTAHLAEVRRVQSTRTPGRMHPLGVRLFLWRLQPCPATRTQAFCAEGMAPERFLFSVLGNDCPLFAAPAAGAARESQVSESQLPVPLYRARIADRHGHIDPRYYGEGKSFALWLSKKARHPIPPENIIVGNLSHWHLKPRRGQIVVDPRLGRIAFAPGEAPDEGLLVSYHYGQVMQFGGGEYPRAMPEWANASTLYTVGPQGDFRSLHEALTHWHRDQKSSAVIEISSSDVYADPVRIMIEEGRSLEIRAADRTRPVIRLLDWHANRPDFFSVSGGPRSRLVLDGLHIAGRGVQVKGDLEQLTIRHCTLVPGWEIESPTISRASFEPSLALSRVSTRVVIEHSILGPILVTRDDPDEAPSELSVSDSVIDAELPQRWAISGAEDKSAHLVMRIVRSTVFGKMRVNAMTLAENCIFNDALFVERRQSGCARFCYVRPGSRTPRRYECQPETATKDLSGALKQESASRVRPVFNSVRYGTPTYAQLADICAPEIAQGADDESEMGVYHDLYQPQRVANLLARLEEYVPADVDVAIVNAT